MKTSPKVSVLVPVYNRAHCIEQTLASALEQTFDDLEVVVVDNCSSDASWELIQRVAARDARVRIFRNDSNIGPVRNWLRCVREARGELGKILWSDDLLHREFLAQAVPPMEDPAVGFVYSEAVMFYGDDPLDGIPRYGSTPPGRQPSAELVKGILLKGDYPVSPSNALFRMTDIRDCLLEQVPNRVKSDFAMHGIGSDALLFLLVAERYPFVYRLNQQLCYFRAHPGTITLTAGGDKVTFNYDIAKAWFVSRGGLPASLVAKFNGALFIDLLVRRGKPFGLRRVADFYPETDRHPVSVSHLPVSVAYVLARMTRKLRRFAQ